MMDKTETKPDAYLICPVCAALNRRAEEICDQCGAPFGAVPNDNPPRLVQPQTSLWGKEIYLPPRFIVLIGLWALFLPALVVSVCFALLFITHRDGLVEFVSFWSSVAIATLSFTILYRVTKNYFVVRDRTRSFPSASTKR